MVETIRSLVRPFIAVSLISVLCYLFIKGMIDPKELIILISVVIGFYFGERAAKKPEDK